ncbi:MAG TPA: phenylalanine--tRNA ligase subunit beta [Anaerolineales bacterium]|nr:phenylalanine--tRNA ligase subunit beta [Anaerolineales bacterium]
MKIPLSWLTDFIDLGGLSVEDIAHKLTLAALEVDEIQYAGLPMPSSSSGQAHEFKTAGIGWDKDKIVVAEIREVKPHPNADRLTLLDLYDGQKEQTVLTGAPNIFHLKGQGRLAKPLKVAYAKEGSTLYDGHAEGLQLTTLKRTKIRGVESYSMVCSEKELGISEEHEGIILFDDDAPVGTPLADYIGDAVFDISILPNMARNANVIGVARELAAMTGRELKQPDLIYQTQGEPVGDLVKIEITKPELNPRFVAGLIRNVVIAPSPYEIQRRLKLAGMRPINCIVDATNYAMLELGEPLHAFDYDVLKQRAGDRPVRIITRTAQDGEKLTTLDGMQRTLTSMNVLVCDEKGPLSIAGIMGGAESEVTEETRNILLEGAAWNFINIRRTAQQHSLPSEASFRFSRGVHPALADVGVRRGLQYMARWSGGAVAPGLVDEYPLKPAQPVVTVTPHDVKRLLGIELAAGEIAALLERLEFACTVRGTEVIVTAPPNRLDIGEGAVGLADVLEEVARLYGYDRIPESNMADELPPQIGNPTHEWEEGLRDLLTTLGFDEVVGYRLTSPESEARLLQGVALDYVKIANPIAPEKSVLRRSVLASVLDDLQHNARLSESLAFFEIGPAFEPLPGDLPTERRELALAMTGSRSALAWDQPESPRRDLFDLKGRIELMLNGLHLAGVTFTPTTSITYLHPGKAAEIAVGGKLIGLLGELHPRVAEKYELTDAPVLVADFDLETMRAVLPSYGIKPVPEFPPILEDIAVIVDETVAASQVEGLIRQTGGKALADVRLFDVYRGSQIGAGKKSLAYSLAYQAPDKTMTDAEAAAIRNKIVRRLEQEVGAKLRS